MRGRDSHWSKRLHARRVSRHETTARIWKGPLLTTVLVLEDEPLAMRMMCVTLRRKNYHVLEAATPTAAIRTGRKSSHLDLLIADVALPESSGVHTAVELCQLFPNLSVLFVSGTPFGGWRPQDLLALQLLPRRVWEFLLKPFEATLCQILVSRSEWHG